MSDNLFPSLRSRSRRILYRLKSVKEEECGNVESALVIIPTMLLFLSVLQIAITALIHGYALNNVQGMLSRSSLLGVQSQDISKNVNPESSNSAGMTNSRTPLAGGGYLMTGTLQTSVPLITPLFPFGDHIQTKTLVVDENP